MGPLLPKLPSDLQGASLTTLSSKRDIAFSTKKGEVKKTYFSNTLTTNKMAFCCLQLLECLKEESEFLGKMIIFIISKVEFFNQKGRSLVSTWDTFCGWHQLCNFSIWRFKTTWKDSKDKKEGRQRVVYRRTKCVVCCLLCVSYMDKWYSFWHLLPASHQVIDKPVIFYFCKVEDVATISVNWHHQNSIGYHYICPTAIAFFGIASFIW